MSQQYVWLIVALAMIWHASVHAQENTSKEAENLATTNKETVVKEQQYIQDLELITKRLDAIASTITGLAKKERKNDYTPAILGFIGVLLGATVSGVVTLLTQRKLFGHERNLAENRARLEIGSSIVQWQIEQLSELYGPLHALLRQSNTLYRHMNNVLAAQDSTRFRLVSEAGVDDFDRMIFEINVDGEWLRFRTIEHIDEVYGHNYGIEDYFDELVSIGDRIVKVITEKAGYTEPSSKDLASVFGKYLAHYSVLKHLHSQLKLERTESGQQGASTQLDQGALNTTMNVDGSAVFPQEIQGLVDRDFNAINAQIAAWREQVDV